MSILLLAGTFLSRASVTGRAPPLSLLRTTTLAPCVSRQFQSRSDLSKPSREAVMDWKDQVNLAIGQDETTVINKLELLLAGCAQNHGWNLCANGKGIQRSFHFKTFKQTWDFMQAVAEKCKSERHHPEWWNAYNHTFIQWTTHKPEGLTIKDVDMAVFCDEQAASHDQLEGKQPTLRRLFDLAEAEI